jgi:isocitrate dehydrogenase
MMLVHVGQPETAERVHNAWLKTIEDGIHTYDVYTEGESKEKVGTKAFARAVVERLGQEPEHLEPARYAADAEPLSGKFDLGASPRACKELVGVDVFLDWYEEGRDPDALAGRLKPLSGDGLELVMITNRGTKVWPEGLPETFRTDHWRCRFMSRNGAVKHAQVVSLLGRINDAGLDFIKTEHLCTFDGEPGFSLGQGQ